MTTDICALHNSRRTFEGAAAVAYAGGLEYCGAPDRHAQEEESEVFFVAAAQNVRKKLTMKTCQKWNVRVFERRTRCRAFHGKRHMCPVYTHPGVLFCEKPRIWAVFMLSVWENGCFSCKLTENRDAKV